MNTDLLDVQDHLPVNVREHQERQKGPNQRSQQRLEGCRLIILVSVGQPPTEQGHPGLCGVYRRRTLKSVPEKRNESDRYFKEKNGTANNQTQTESYERSRYEMDYILALECPLGSKWVPGLRTTSWADELDVSMVNQV